MSVLIDDRPLTETVREVMSVEGALAPAVELLTPQALANAPGAWGSGVTVAARGITVGLDVLPSSLPDRVTVLDTLKRRVGGLRLFRMTDAPTRELYVTLTKVQVECYHLSIPRCFVLLEFSAVDPTRYEREMRAVALSTSRAEALIGTAASAPMLYLYGACTNPVVIVRNAGGDETHRLTLTVVLATNDTLVIDSARQHIDRYVAGVLQTGVNSGNAALTSGAFPLLAPEDSIEGAGITVELTATSGTPTGLLLYARGY